MLTKEDEFSTEAFRNACREVGGEVRESARNPFYMSCHFDEPNRAIKVSKIGTTYGVTQYDEDNDPVIGASFEAEATTVEWGDDELVIEGDGFALMGKR